MPGEVRIGTAGWSIPKRHADVFPAAGSHLERYAARLAAVEINSSFYRPHRPATYARWAAAVPHSFRFAVKVPREITHARRLVAASEPLDRFLGEVAALGGKLGPVLVQLPPSLRFDAAIAVAFFADLRARFGGTVACEPRHRTWFEDDAAALLAFHRIARVAADPAVVPRAAEPGGWEGLIYHRRHGSPDVYRSAYAPASLAALARRLVTDASCADEVWCVFDNTAEGHAAGDALAVMDRLRPPIGR
jgi:uncharacterized protein YecE (DUF72 family)